MKKSKPQQYRWNSYVHVYHQDVLGEYDGGMFMDQKMTQKYSHEIKMPMHDLFVYVQIPADDDADCSQHKDTSEETPVTL